MNETASPGRGRVGSIRRSIRISGVGLLNPDHCGVVEGRFESGNFLKESCFQESGAVDHPQDMDCPSGNSENRPVLAVEQMSVTGAEELIFRNQGASFRKILKRPGLAFQLQHELVGIFGIVFGNKGVNLLDIPFRRLGDLNLEFYGHAGILSEKNGMSEYVWQRYPFLQRQEGGRDCRP